MGNCIAVNKDTQSNMEKRDKKPPQAEKTELGVTDHK